jgi:hypothetical protein
VVNPPVIAHVTIAAIGVKLHVREHMKILLISGLIRLHRLAEYLERLITSTRRLFSEILG